MTDGELNVDDYLMIKWLLQAGIEDSSAWINCLAEYVCYKPVQKTVQPGQTA